MCISPVEFCARNFEEASEMLRIITGVSHNRSEALKKVGFDASCQYVVPQAISCFLESKDFEDAIRTAVSSGGDSDTVADIAGALAEACWGIPEKFKVLTEKKNDELLMSFINDVNKEWEKFVNDIKPLKRKKKWLFF